eukprot:366471-Chlamydomonas_euryale.AAC.3
MCSETGAGKITQGARPGSSSGVQQLANRTQQHEGLLARVQLVPGCAVHSRMCAWTLVQQSVQQFMMAACLFVIIICTIGGISTRLRKDAGA